MTLSVGMAVYNGEHYLAEAINSVLGQTYKDFEFVIVDDGSTDGTPRILQEFAAQDPRIQIIRQSNMGVAAARNTAIENARYDLVAWMDADDRMLPNRLERQIAFATANPDHAVYCSYAYLINSTGKRVGISNNNVDLPAARLAEKPSLFLNIVNPSALLRRDAILAVGGYNPAIRYAEDRELWGRLATSGAKILCQPEPLTEYRLHGNTTTGKKALDTRHLVRWIDHNIVRRWQGKSDICLEEYIAWTDSQPFWRRFNSERIFFAGFNYKRAVRYYAENKLLYFAFYASAAMLLRPLDTFHRATSKLGK
jgi:alpha-1,3-rhamnosyltransferase